MARTNLRYLGRELSLDEAHSLFRSARNAACLAALGRNSSAEAVLLRARCFLRLRDPVRAVDALTGLQIDGLEPARISEYHVLRATALLRSGDRVRARRHYEAAEIIARPLGGAAVAELDFYLALEAWTDRDLDTAERRAAEALAVEPLHAETYARRHELVSAQVLETMSLIAAAREDFATQAALLERAWDAQASLSPGERDGWVCASILRNLAPIVWDLHLRAEAEFLAARSEEMSWTPETAYARYVVQRALAWGAALSGNHLAAFARFREAIDIAPSEPYKLASTLDRAYLAAEMGQKVILAEEMLRVRRLASSIDWPNVVGDEAHVLLTVAEAYAREDARAARSWLAQFDRERAMPKSLLLVASHDRRQTAMEDDAEAAVLAAEGKIERAVSLRRSTVETWSKLGHGWRAARAAVALAELTSKPEDAADACRRVEAFRRSWLVRRVRRIPSARARTAVLHRQA